MRPAQAFEGMRASRRGKWHGRHPQILRRRLICVKAIGRKTGIDGFVTGTLPPSGDADWRKGYRSA
jgi:hypothetical protein